MTDKPREWLLATAAEHGDVDARKAALFLLMGDLLSLELAKMPRVASWAARPVVDAADIVRERFGDTDVTAALYAFPTTEPRPVWTRMHADLVPMCALLLAVSGMWDRDDDRDELLKRSGRLGDTEPTYTVEDALKAAEVARRFGTGEWCSAATLVGALGVPSLCAIADEPSTEDWLMYAVESAADVEFSAGRRVEVAMMYAKVLRDNGLPVDGTVRRRRLLGAICKHRPTVDEVVAGLDDDVLDLIDHFTVDDEPITALLEAAFGDELPPWMRPLIG